MKWSLKTFFVKFCSKFLFCTWYANGYYGMFFAFIVTDLVFFSKFYSLLNEYRHCPLHKNLRKEFHLQLYTFNSTYAKSQTEMHIGRPCTFQPKRIRNRFYISFNVYVWIYENPMNWKYNLKIYYCFCVAAMLKIKWNYKEINKIIHRLYEICSGIFPITY